MAMLRFDKQHIEFFVAVDMMGDACLYAQWIDNSSGEPKRYLTEDELKSVVGLYKLPTAD